MRARENVGVRAYGGACEGEVWCVCVCVCVWREREREKEREREQQKHASILYNQTKDVSLVVLSG